jgi:hypothetical protein
LAGNFKGVNICFFFKMREALTKQLETRLEEERSNNTSKTKEFLEEEVRLG